MERLLRGDLPPGGKCDLNTLAAEAGVARTAFYAKKHRDGSTRPGPYQHLAQEFDRRLKSLREAGEIVDPRLAQIERLREPNTTLQNRLTRQDAELADLTDFKQRALSRIAAQYLEIERLGEQIQAGGKVSSLLKRRPPSSTIGSCS
ncbi:hypothetical protein ACIQV3_36015 [Streptomyces sp. NPDC099050]|uniref:hypothetical protein n=1 Tax=Streptomyces sp. NPDC099050 TaxID=3366100 RepID=UPI0037F168DC